MAEKATKSALHVSAILVVHDGARWLPEVVASLMSQSRHFDDILAVDTGSTDSSKKLLTTARLSCLELEREVGFGDAVWIATQSLEENENRENEWLWILHDDCVMASDALEQLINAVEDRPQVVMAGPKILGWHDRSHLLEIGISIASDGARWTGLEQHEYDQGQRDGVHEVLAVSTAGALIRRDVFEDLGGFDHNLSLFRDDVDFGWRVRVAGHSVIAVSEAKAFHAEASASERRPIDVANAFLHRPLLLDRRNAAYVLLANSTWWMLPWLFLQLLGSSIARSIAYLVAKLPGYASDEILAIITLVIHPRELISARKFRRKHRLISARVVKEFIPPRRKQIRQSIERLFDSIRLAVLPVAREKVSVDEVITDDEDLLSPVDSPRWRSIFRKPKVIAGSIMMLVLLAWSRNRFGNLVGGSLPATPSGARDLWSTYFESWHQVGMGSESAAPPWIAVLASLATVLLGKASLLITLGIFFAPLFFMLSSYRAFSRITPHEPLRVGASFLYAISPVSIASINSGRIGTLAVLLLLPFLAIASSQWSSIERVSWRKLFAYSLLLSVLFSFSTLSMILLLSLTTVKVALDYREFLVDGEQSIFRIRIVKRLVLLLVPFLVLIPWSFKILSPLSGILLEPGIATSGGGFRLAMIANPGGAGSVPWWIVAPFTALIIIGLFSRTRAKAVAEFGFGALGLSVILGSLTITGNGSSTPTRVWVGSLIACATLAAIITGVIILDRLREILVVTNFHFRHMLALSLTIATVFYSITSIFWVVTAGSDSPVRATSQTVLPAFLGAEAGSKTVVLREVNSNGRVNLQYYITRGHDAFLGEPDLAPVETEEITKAVRELVDGTGISSSKTLARFGIKYLFVKNSENRELIQTIDGLGGFARASSTSAGVVWRVSGALGRLIYISRSGDSFPLESSDVGARTNVPGPGTILLTDTYSRSWQIFQNGVRLERSQDRNGLTTFRVEEKGEISLVHDGTIRRGFLSLQLVLIVLVLVLAAPSGRRKREISEKELT
ncbi:unannotated protein [freshwater metagenome]|uniref:Unannotated protein n=1 Tax=freshwater metagenome TaxID=449393 RepID=A0A6J7XTL2_9ZZZZ|nr:glycosyltransferase [Actinomycetota bacterium]